MTREHGCSWMVSVLRLIVIILDNIITPPTYYLLLAILQPLRLFSIDLYWRIEGYLFLWAIGHVACWSHSAGYVIHQSGAAMEKMIGSSALVLVNHQCMSDVPMLMQAWQNSSILPRIMWIMDILFKWTNVGIVSNIHHDFFIAQGKSTRQSQLVELEKHLKEEWPHLPRSWLVLFPEGGFLYKRRANSQAYARAHGWPHFEHVTLPRIGALQVILKTIGVEKRPESMTNHCQPMQFSVNGQPFRWIVDVTLAYPKLPGHNFSFVNLILGRHPPTPIHLHYRLFPAHEVLFDDSQQLMKWIVERWSEKEAMLKQFSLTGRFSETENDEIISHAMPFSFVYYAWVYLFFGVLTYIFFKLAMAVWYSSFLYSSVMES